MDPATLEFLKWLLGGAASTLFFLQLFTGQPLEFLGQVFGADKREMKRLRAENRKLHRLLDGVQTEVKALPANTENDALLERIESLEAIATGDHQPKVEA